MSELPFIKMHGAGNDYVFVDGFVTTLPDNAPELAQRLSYRNFGVGADGLVYMIPPTNDSIDVKMRMWNADGSEGAMCGNALRCIALWMHKVGRAAKTCRAATASGEIHTEILSLNAGRNQADVRVQLPPPVLPTGGEQTLDDVRFTEVSVGNPHAVIFVDELSDRCVQQLGTVISTHPRFPGGINVEFVRVISANELEVRVYERGSGETLACGSGACAAVAAAVSKGLCQQNTPITVSLPGGNLHVLWHDPRGEGAPCLQLTGPAEISFEGVWQG